LHAGRLTDSAAVRAAGCEAPLLPISDHRALIVDVREW
jgi:hypothetical protein